MKIFAYSLIFISSLALAISPEDSYQVRLEKVNDYRLLNGEVEAVNKATVSAQTAGRVQKLYYDVDDLVSKGSIIVEFTNTEQKSKLNEAQGLAQAAKIAYEQAQTDYQRIKDVFAKKLVAKSQLDQALSNRDALKAQYSAAQSAVVAAQKQFEYTIIRAPYDGIVTNRYVELGETVNPGTAIMEGLSLNQLRVVTHIPEKIINQVKSNPQANIIVNSQNISADKITIFPYAEKSSRTFKARIDLNADKTQLFPGMTVKVALKTGERQALLIPQSAIINRSELSLVSLVVEGKKSLRHVKTGSIHGDKIEVISGLSPNEIILINPLGE